jgi:CubicO group peptidase (beta-lactamase class C family)
LQPAPVPEWSAPDDPRSRIRIADLLHMSSGLRIKAPNDPDYDGKGYPDHLYLYTGDENLFHYAATRPLEWPPNTVGRYRNTDPMIINYLIRLAAEKQHGDYFSFPQRELFDQVGIRTMVLEPDTYGNFLNQGYVLACARDWARLGLLYLQDGVWNGKRILPQGFVKFVSTVAPTWDLDKQPEYGGFFWINGIGRLPIPKDAYFMGGAGNQFTIIIPSRDLVVVRLGIYKGDGDGFRATYSSLSLLMKAIPENSTPPS